MSKLVDKLFAAVFWTLYKTSFGESVSDTGTMRLSLSIKPRFGWDPFRSNRVDGEIEVRL